MFAEVFSTTTIFAVIVAVSNALVGFFAYLLALHNSKNDKETQKQEKIDEVKKKIDDACDNGDLSKLLDAAKSMRVARRK